jgi:hypothetical protein
VYIFLVAGLSELCLDVTIDLGVVLACTVVDKWCTDACPLRNHDRGSVSPFMAINEFTD